MNNLTFLTEEQIFGDNQLDILKKYGTKCAITDFSILLGGYVAKNHYTCEGNSRKDRTGWWWTQSSWKSYEYNGVCAVAPNGDDDAINAAEFYGGARPALHLTSFSYIPLTSNRVRGINGIIEIGLGEYLQDIVSEDFARTLERIYQNRTINQTGKSYTTGSVGYQEPSILFRMDSHMEHEHNGKDFIRFIRPKTHIEYEYNGKKYIRFVADYICSGEVLSDGRTIQNGDVYWVSVEPIIWMIDERTNIVLSKKIIFSGVLFDRASNYKGNFDRTNIKEFMDRCFSKDIIPSFSIGINPEEKKQIEANKTEKKKSRKKKKFIRIQF